MVYFSLYILAILAYWAYGNTHSHNHNKDLGNPIAIIPPYNGSDPGYIIVSCSAGLSNRLRVLASFMWISEKTFDGAHLVMVWDVNEACPGHFLELFEPINNVIFTTSDSVTALYSQALQVYDATTETLRAILIDFNVTESHTAIQKHMYARIIPNNHIMHKATKIIDQYGICKQMAMHVRSTDLLSLIGPKRAIGTLPNRIKEIAAMKEGQYMYLLTDDPNMQQRLITMFPTKIVVYQRIKNVTDHHFTWTPSTESNTALNYSIEHRFTSLEHTLVDVVIAAHAKYFRGTPFSSLSDLVAIYNTIGKKWWAWCFKKD